VTSINEPATAVKVDGRWYLNKRPPPTPGNYWWWVRPAASVECIRLLWNVSVTLITPRPQDRCYRAAGRSVFVGDADSATYYVRSTRRSRVVRNIW